MPGHVVGQLLDARHHVVDLVLAELAGAECRQQVIEEAAEVLRLDAATVVRLGHGAPGVEARSVESQSEELALHALELLGLDALEEGTQLRIGEHPPIEVADQGADPPLATDSHVEGLRIGHGYL